MANRLVMDLHIAGRLSADTLTLPAGAVTSEKITGPIDAEKLGTRYHLEDFQVPGTPIVAKTKDLRIMRASGAVLDIDAVLTGALADDASRHVTIDLQKSTGGGAFATMLTGVIDLTMSATLRVATGGTLASTALAAGDVLRAVTAVSGGSGNQAQGLQITVTVSENPN